MTDVARKYVHRDNHEWMAQIVEAKYRCRSRRGRSLELISN